MPLRVLLPVAKSSLLSIRFSLPIGFGLSVTRLGAIVRLLPIRLPRGGRLPRLSILTLRREGRGWLTSLWWELRRRR